MGTTTNEPEVVIFSLPRLLQLASPTLPVGAYSYSQGLEAAVEAAIVTDAPSAELGIDVPIEQPALPTAFACAARAWGISSHEAAVAYLWSWLENQVMAAVKAVPLGQTAGQKILLELGGRLDAIAEKEVQWSNFAPGLAFLSARHETQYSRLFRS